MKPCKQPCPKCGSTDIYRLFKHQNQKWDDKDLDVSNFINRLSDFDVQATRDCIVHHCRGCQFNWQTKPLPKVKAKGTK